MYKKNLLSVNMTSKRIPIITKRSPTYHVPRIEIIHSRSLFDRTLYEANLENYESNTFIFPYLNANFNDKKSKEMLFFAFRTEFNFLTKVINCTE